MRKPPPSTTGKTRGLLWLLAAAALTLNAAEREIPPAFGPYLNPQRGHFTSGRSYRAGDRIVGTYYFYWYDSATRLHLVDPEDGSDALTDHPPTLEDFSYKSVAWHKRQLADMIEAGIDFLLPVFWGAPSERSETAALHWSYAGLGPLVQAREELLKEGKRPPRIGLFYDTSTLQYNEWREHIDLTTDYGKRWFYATVRDFFSAIPPRHWAMIEGRPIVLLYAAAFAQNHDQSFADYTKVHFAGDFSGREPYLVPQDSWRAKGDNVCAWGGALGLRNPGVAELGPGYDDTAVYGRKPLIAKRLNGKFYEDNWLRFLRRPSNVVMIETWNEFHEGTDICESKEYGRQYIELTRKYVDRFKEGWSPPWPKGKLSRAKSVTAQAGQAPLPGLLLVEHEDGEVRQDSRQGRPGWTTKPSAGRGGYIYFRIDDTFKWDRQMNAVVEVEYFDASAGSLGVEYDGDDLAAPGNGAYTRTERIPVTGSQKWKTARFQIKSAFFTNSQNSQSDFRLVAECPDIAVGRVTVRRR